MASKSKDTEQPEKPKREPWTLDEVELVLERAGFSSLDTIAQWLGREVLEVDTVAAVLGLNVALTCPDLQWCDECASWRTLINQRGKCQVCQIRDNLEKREAACAEVWERMPPDLRETYRDNEVRRSTRPQSFESYPSITTPPNATRDERKRLAAYRAQAVELWEYRRILREYNATKKRLQRMRAHLGENPRINKRRDQQNGEQDTPAPGDACHTVTDAKAHETDAQGTNEA